MHSHPYERIEERDQGHDLDTGRTPYTMLHSGEQAASAFPRETLDRLRDLKRARDPRGVIRSNFPVL